MHKHILIEALSPSVDCGKYPAKAIAGEPCTIEADIFRDGHAEIKAVVKWQKEGDAEVRETPLTLTVNDRFRGEIFLDEVATYLFTIEAWTDRFASWQHDFLKKAEAGR